jgi:hypothetical protein
MLASQIKFDLDRLTMEKGITLMGVHSCRLIEGTELDLLFETSDELFHYRCPLPQLVNKEDISMFAAWLCCPDLGEVTLH